VAANTTVVATLSEVDFHQIGMPSSNYREKNDLFN